MGLLIIRSSSRQIDAAPIDTVKDGGGSDVEEDDGVAGPYVVAHRPLHRECTLVAQIYGYGYLTRRPCCRSDLWQTNLEGGRLQRESQRVEIERKAERGRRDEAMEDSRGSLH